MKILFLDIDGVLNTHEVTIAMCGQIHKDKITRLNKILEVTDCKIVLSSAWRYIIHRGEANLQGLDWLFRSHGMLPNRLIGITPPDTMIPKIYNGVPKEWPVENERGSLITRYLFENHPLIENKDYMVIDDMDLGIKKAGHPFVQTDSTEGLQDRHVDEIINHFRRN